MSQGQQLNCFNKASKTPFINIFTHKPTLSGSASDDLIHLVSLWVGWALVLVKSGVGGWEGGGRQSPSQSHALMGADPLRSSGTAGRGCLLQVTVSLVGINLGGTSMQQLCVCVCVCLCNFPSCSWWLFRLTAVLIYVVIPLFSVTVLKFWYTE